MSLVKTISSRKGGQGQLSKGREAVRLQPLSSHLQLSPQSHHHHQKKCESSGRPTGHVQLAVLSLKTVLGVLQNPQPKLTALYNQSRGNIQYQQKYGWFNFCPFLHRWRKKLTYSTTVKFLYCQQNCSKSECAFIFHFLCLCTSSTTQRQHNLHHN